MATAETTTPPSPGSLGRHAARISLLSAIYMLGTIAPQVISMLLLPVFTRFLPPAQMGIVTLATRFVGLLGIVVQLGLFSGLKMQYFHLDLESRPRAIRTVLWGQVAQGVAICAILSLAGLWVAGPLLPNLPLSTGEVQALWSMIVWGCLFVALIQMEVGLAQLLERAGTAVSIGFLWYAAQTALGLAAVVGCGWQGLGRQATIFAGTALAGVVGARWMLRFGSGPIDLGIFRHIGLKGLAFVPHQLAGLLALSINAWLLNKLASPDALAIYGMAVAFVGLIDMPLTSFGNAAYPTLAQLMRDGSPEAMRQQSRLYTVLALGVVGLTLGVALFAPIGIRILTAPEYHESQHLVWILSLGWLFQGLYLLVAQPVFFFGGGLWMASATVVSLAVSVPVALVLIPGHHFYGAAWALSANLVISFLVAAWASHRLYRLPWETSRIFRAMVCGVLIGAADYYLLRGASLPAAIVLKTLLLALLLPLWWLTRSVTTSELLQMKSLVVSAIQARQARWRDTA